LTDKHSQLSTSRKTVLYLIISDLRFFRACRLVKCYVYLQ